MSSSDDGHIYGLAGFGFFCLTAISVAIMISVDSEQAAIVAKHAPAPVAITAVSWTPCEAPRPDVACWRSGQAVVCLPLTPEETE
jgi:hypothetical protein